MQLVYRSGAGIVVTQAAVSRQIGVLEAYLRIKLFDRTSARSPSRRMQAAAP